MTMELLPILLNSCAIIAATLVADQLLSGYPISQLGQRPMGRGLITRFFHQLRDSTGVWCYDPILGAWSPLAKALLHSGLIGVITSIGSIVIHTFFCRDDGTDDICSSDKDTFVGLLAIVIGTGYVLFLYWYNHMVPNVSHPGGPRKSKIQRMPKFPDQVSTIASASKNNVVTWRCAVADDAHQVTENNFQGLPGILTGEPFGRQMWTTSNTATTSNGAGSGKSKTTTKPVDEQLVKQMALGGRSDGFNPSHNPNSADTIFRAQQIKSFLSSGKKGPDIKSVPSTAREACKKAIQFYQMLQTDDGHWAGDYGGPHFLMPGLIIAWYVMGRPSKLLNENQVAMMTHYISCHQQTDGGWGTHIESPSTMFGTVLMYVALRLLGVSFDDERCQRGHAFIQQHGGALMTSSWSKFYLCLLGCMEWEGHNSVPAEMFLLPNWFPFHPGRLWCHCRMVYLPMSYLYGSRFVYANAESDPLVQSLRKELYCEPYESIPWIRTRHWVSDLDNYSQLPIVMRFLQNVLAYYETLSFLQPIKNWIRKYGLEFSIKYIDAEDLQTNFIDIGPVNKVLNMLSVYHACGFDAKNPNVLNHMRRVPDYLWVAEDGMKMQGYNGSQCWDTSFTIQAVAEAGLLDDFPEMSKKVWSFLERTQILSTETSRSSPAYKYESNDFRKMFYRHVSEGGWPFSTSAHGWPISDCTAEGLKGVLCLQHNSKSIKDGLVKGELLGVGKERLEKAVNVILTLQNEDGGWATYENNRGFGWYELLNPSEVFGDIMIDYSYVECSCASLTALVEFLEYYPNHVRSEEICHAIAKGREFMKSIQREDGSWYGSWACCFCYGGWFGIEGLVKAGEPLDSDNIKKACEFFLSHQRPNGGWGEDFTSCYDKAYAKDGMDAYGDEEGSGIVNTSWALLALASAKCKDIDAIKRGIMYLRKRQLPSGDWPQEGIAGVFNRACGITYTAYRNAFPIWALGRCASVYGDAIDE